MNCTHFCSGDRNPWEEISMGCWGHFSPLCLWPQNPCAHSTVSTLQCWHSEMGPTKALGAGPRVMCCYDSLGGFMQIWLTWLVSGDGFSCAICSAFNEVRAEKCSKCHDSMMRWALTHLLMIFQNMLLHFSSSCLLCPSAGCCISCWQ